MPRLGTDERPLRVAIVGSGPSGFYAAEALLNAAVKVKVDMFDRLPTPFGLVRYGVAPDHPKIKSVVKVYEKIAGHEQFNFLGNVTVGRDIAVNELHHFYDAVIFACGAQTDRALGIPGENLPGSYTATEFVAWYNGHPDYRNRQFDLSHEVAVVVGQGNVSMDVSRILSKTADELKSTDIAQHALVALAQSKIREIHLIGRRGPAQAAFTPPEIKEFGELLHCDPVVDPADLRLNPESEIELNDINNAAKKKNFETLKEFAARPVGQKAKKFYIHFLQSPRELKGNGRVEQLVLEKNKLTGTAGTQQAQGTGELTQMACGLFFRSVGYRGVPISGVPFDEKKGTFPNKNGRILNGETTVNGLYAVGWIKRGPSGVIGTNKPDSVATVESLLADAASLTPAAQPDTQKVLQTLKAKNVKVVGFNDWKKIDLAETERGAKSGKTREKFVKIEEMLNVVSQ